MAKQIRMAIRFAKAFAKALASELTDKYEGYDGAFYDTDMDQFRITGVTVEDNAILMDVEKDDGKKYVARLLVTDWRRR